MFQHVLTGFNWMPLDSLIVLLIPPRNCPDKFWSLHMLGDDLRWTHHYTSLRFSMIFWWIFHGFPGFSRIFSHLGVIVMCCRPGSWATVPPLLLTEPMTRSCWRRPQSMQTPNTVPVFWCVLMCSDVFCSYTSYHFIHVWEILRFPKRPKMVTFCRSNATFATFCCCECCGQFCRCTARGRGQAGDEDASTGSQGKTTGKLRHKDRAHSFRQKTKRCSRDDPKMKERTSKKYHKVDLGNWCTESDRASKIPTRDM